ncbi:MAG TPA: helix-turn-helix transcriptional regulator [Stellaceae bacterium]|nr:helix-turn-helix transcriptional regulator [Stellaceae bacterium]
MARKPVSPPASATAPSPARQTKRRTRPTVAQAGPHPVDVHVGSRVRLARLLAGKTQQWLAAQVQLTFQQVQKYERGANRISCSMLSEFATALDRTIPWFFLEGPVEASEAGKINHEVGERQRLTYELTSNFARIKNERARQHLVALVRAFTEGQPREAEAGPKVDRRKASA